MTYIFIDESGDLGFSDGSSRYFVFTAVLCDDYRELERIIKKARKSLSKKHKKVRELHAYHADSKTRKRVLQGLMSVMGMKVTCILLDKEKIDLQSHYQKNDLYNHAVKKLLDRLISSPLIPPYEVLRIIVDRKDTNKHLRENFEQSILEPLRKKHQGPITVHLRTSHEEKSLQAVDFISWALFRKYERNDFYYHEIIKGLLIEEYLLFP
jgi:hypothetical protein